MRIDLNEVAFTLESFASRMREAADGKGRLVSYGPVDQETRKYLTIMYDTWDTYERFSIDDFRSAITALLKAIDSLPETEPPEEE